MVAKYKDHVNSIKPSPHLQPKSKGKNSDTSSPKSTTTYKPTTTKMTQTLTHQARSTYRALLRELPRKTLSTPSPLHQRLRAVFRLEAQNPSTPSAPTTPSQTSSIASSSHPIAFSIPANSEERALRVQEAEQLAQYARAQRVYVELLERYNPGMNLDEEERIRLTARRVGMELPVLHEEEGKERQE